MRHYHWPPQTIEELTVDDDDYNGLVFNYNAVNDYIKELKSKQKK